MGRHILRGKALAALAVALVVAAAGWGEDPATREPAVDDGPLAPVQGHRGAEMYSLAFPDEDIIGGFVDGFLATRRDWLQGVLDRSRRYLSVIVPAIAARGLPRELAYLPAVESGFRPRAVSPKGATGLWQLMSTTAAPYGLRMDQWVDERRDFWKSTDASLRKLEENERRFGDWFLALAAYNCGAGKLSGILAKNPGSDFWTLRRKGVLPRETAAFVPQFLALTRILSYPGRHGLAIGWDQSTAWTRIALDRCIDLRVLARESGVPLEVLTEGNTELNFPITPPKSYGYQLKVPAEYRAAVEATLATATMPLLEFRVHVVAEGDTLFGMALRYGVTVELLEECNPTVKPRALRIGSRVLVPTAPSRSSG